MKEAQAIINELKKRGKRITKQRLIMIEVIMEQDCNNLKELYYAINKRDATIGQATVYRMITTLEEIGAIKRVQGYTISTPLNTVTGPDHVL